MLVKRKKKKVNGFNFLNQLVNDICETDAPSAPDIPYPKTSRTSRPKSVKVGGSAFDLKDVIDKTMGDEPSILDAISSIFTKKRTSARKKS